MHTPAFPGFQFGMLCPFSSTLAGENTLSSEPLEHYIGVLCSWFSWPVMVFEVPLLSVQRVSCWVGLCPFSDRD